MTMKFIFQNRQAEIAPVKVKGIEKFEASLLDYETLSKRVSTRIGVYVSRTEAVKAVKEYLNKPTKAKGK